MVRYEPLPVSTTCRAAERRVHLDRGNVFERNPEICARGKHFQSSAQVRIGVAQVLKWLSVQRSAGRSKRNIFGKLLFLENLVSRFLGVERLRLDGARDAWADGLFPLLELAARELSRRGRRLCDDAVGRCAAATAARPRSATIRFRESTITPIGSPTAPSRI